MTPLRWAILATLALACRGEAPEAGEAGPPAALAPASPTGELTPIVDPVLGFLLGGARDGAWVPAEQAVAALQGGEMYHAYSPLRVAGPVVGGAPEPAGDVCPGSFLVRLDPPREEAAIALGADWNALPRLPERIGPASPVDRAAVEAFLRARGLAAPDVRIDRILRVDLDGNGTTEVLIGATRSTHAPADPQVVAGDYSLVLLRRADGGGIQIPLEADVYSRDDPFSVPNEHVLAGAFDLDGDGKMEVVVRTLYYEGASASVFEIGETEVRRVLIAECGV